MGIKEALCWRSIRRRSSPRHDGGSSSTSRIAVTAARNACRNHAGVPRARERRPGARRRANAVARDGPAALRDTDREKAKKLGVRSTTSTTRSPARSAPTTSTTSTSTAARAGADVGRSAYRTRPDDIAGLRPLGQGRDDPAFVARDGQVLLRPDALDRFNNLPAVKIIGQAAPASPRPGDRARREHRLRVLRRTSASTGGHLISGEALGGASGFALRWR